MAKFKRHRRENVQPEDEPESKRQRRESVQLEDEPDSKQQRRETGNNEDDMKELLIRLDQRIEQMEKRNAALGKKIDFVVARYQSTDGCANGGGIKEKTVSSDVVSPCTVITCSIHSLSACTFRAACI